MPPTIEQLVQEDREVSRRFRERIRDNPAEAKAFLIRAGILKPDPQTADTTRTAPPTPATHPTSPAGDR